MVTWVLTTPSRFDFERRTQLFCWTSHSFAVLGEQPCDLASVLISGDGSSRIAFAAAPFMRAIANHAAAANLQVLRGPRALRQFVAGIDRKSS
jgi:hypothetical protein